MRWESTLVFIGSNLSGGFLVLFSLVIFASYSANMNLDSCFRIKYFIVKLHRVYMHMFFYNFTHEH